MRKPHLGHSARYNGHRFQPLSRAEELACVSAAQAGDLSARDRLITGNLRLVKAIAGRYCGPALEMDELVAEGVLGLIYAIGRYRQEVADAAGDPQGQPMRFISYAVWWVRQRILAAVYGDASLLRIPASRVSDMQTCEKHIAAMQQRFGRDPSIEELAASTGLTAGRVAVALKVRVPDAALDGADDELDESRMQLVLDTAEPADEAVARAELVAMADAAISQLEPRQQMIVRWRYGLDDGQAKTLEQIGELLHVTRERVRQLHNRAMRQMRRGLDADQPEDVEAADAQEGTCAAPGSTIRLRVVSIPLRHTVAAQDAAQAVPAPC